MTEKMFQPDSEMIQRANKRVEGMLSTINFGVILGSVCNNNASIEECLNKLLTFYDENRHHIPMNNRKQIQGKIHRFRIIHEFKDTSYTVDVEKRIDLSLKTFEKGCIEDQTVIMSNVVDLSTSYIYVERILEGVRFLEIILRLFDENAYRRISIDTGRIVNRSFAKYAEDFFQGNSIIHGGQCEVSVVIDNVCISLAENAFSPNAIALEYLCMIHLSVNNRIKFHPSLYVLQVDSLVYASFLLFLCYRKLEENVQQIMALEKMKVICRTKDIDCPDIAWNLLGYCYIEMNQAKYALDAFYRATKQKKCIEEMIQRRPSQATNVFVAILINKQLTKEWSKVYDTE